MIEGESFGGEKVGVRTLNSLVLQDANWLTSRYTCARTTPLHPRLAPSRAHPHFGVLHGPERTRGDSSVNRGKQASTQSRTNMTEEKQSKGELIAPEWPGARGGSCRSGA